MAERCNDEVYKQNPEMRSYDEQYYRHIMPYITGSVLDVGCGACMFIKEYINKSEVTSVLGIDKYGNEFFEHPKATYQKMTIPQDMDIDKVFDTIVSTEFVEHIERDQLEPLLEKVQKMMHKDSVFVGSTPDKMSPTTNPFHLYEYRQSELLSIFKNYFTEVEMWNNGRNTTIWHAKL